MIIQSYKKEIESKKILTRNTKERLFLYRREIIIPLKYIFQKLSEKYNYSKMVTYCPSFEISKPFLSATFLKQIFILLAVIWLWILIEQQIIE